jgi:hypothetical protein
MEIDQALRAAVCSVAPGNQDQDFTQRAPKRRERDGQKQNTKILGLFASLSGIAPFA